MATNDDVLKELKKLTGLAGLRTQAIASISANVAQILSHQSASAIAQPGSTVAQTAQAVAGAIAQNQAAQAAGPNQPAGATAGVPAATTLAQAIANAIAQHQGNPSQSPGTAPARAQVAAKTRLGRFIQHMRGSIKKGRKIGRKVGLGASRIAGASRATGAAVGGALGVAGGIAGGAAGLVTGFLAAKDAVAGWTTAALDSKKHLLELSGQMAAIFSEKEFRDSMRDRQTAANTAESTGRLMESEARRKDASRPISDALDNVANNVLAFLNDALAKVMEKANAFLRWAHVLDEDETPPAEGIVGMMPDVQREMDRIDREAKAMMDKARDAAGRFGVAAPAGAAKPGRIGVVP